MVDTHLFATTIVLLFCLYGGNVEGQYRYTKELLESYFIDALPHSFWQMLSRMKHEHQNLGGGMHPYFYYAATPLSQLSWNIRARHNNHQNASNSKITILNRKKLYIYICMYVCMYNENSIYVYSCTPSPFGEQHISISPPPTAINIQSNVYPEWRKKFTKYWHWSRRVFCNS